VKSTLSADTKDALARDVPETTHCREALAAALALYGSRDGVVLRASRGSVARLFLRLTASASQARPHHASDRARPALPIPPDLRSSPPLPVRRCDRASEVRGAFLACGSLAAGPSGYHVEFVLRDEGRAARLSLLLRSLGHTPERAVRRGAIVLYYKDFERIVGILGAIGAYGAVLALEDLRAVRETKNRIHRLVNGETANLERAARAAARQCALIERLAREGRLEHASAAVREIAELRLAHPELSLAELGRRCDPPLGKATVAGRLAALARMAERAPLRARRKEPAKQAR
jgi:hypothetical protein